MARRSDLACAQDDGGPAVAVDLLGASASLQIWRRGDEVVFRALDPAELTLRQVLAAGHTLGTASREALALDASFDLPSALRELFQDDSPIAFTVDTKEE